MRYGTTWTVRDIAVDTRRDELADAHYVLCIGSTTITLEGSRPEVRQRAAELLGQDRRGERAF